MSVINQMLKDLEQRNSEPKNDMAQQHNIVLGHSAQKIALITGFSVLALCLVSFYIWQLMSENRALKAEKTTSQLTNKIQNQLANQAANQVASQLLSQTGKQNSNQNEVDSVNNKHTHIVKSLNAVGDNQAAVISLKATKKEPDALNKIPRNSDAIIDNSSQVIPAKKLAVIKDIDKPSELSLVPNNDNDFATKAKPKVKKNIMSVSRRQLSADELAEQKLALVEKALASQQIEKAEKLLEDVVIIRPSDSQTRKKLAALWFGRQAYQDAVNLLSQGIAFNAKDSSLREMKARIHLKQGQFTAALNTLTPLAQLENEQYQIMLANTAQQAQQNSVAINAYQMLIAMQPELGRWHLGLAVLYDKSSQFNLANVAYKKALSQNDLSVSSENFVKQRIKVIGQ